MRGNRIVKDRTAKAEKTRETLETRRKAEEDERKKLKKEREMNASRRRLVEEKRQQENLKKSVMETLGGAGLISGEDALSAEETAKLLEEIDRDMGSN